MIMDVYYDKLSEHCEVFSGYAFKSQDLLTEGDIPVVKIGNISNGRDLILDKDTQYVDKIFLSINEKYHIKKGDVLISLTGSHINQPNSMVGRSCRYYKNQELLLNQRAGKILAKTNNDLSFLYYMFSSWAMKVSITNRAYGAANQANVSPSDILSIKFNFPNYECQKKIGLILSRYDEAIENNNKRIKLLERMAQNLYKEWFVRFRFPGYENCEFKNGIPVGWKVEKVKNLVKRLPFGKTYKKQELSNIGKIIVIDQSEDEVLGYHDDVPSHKASFDEPVALFGDHSCKYVLMTEDFSLGENIIPYLGNNIDLYYLYYSVYKIIQTEEYKRHWNLFINKKILVPIEEFQLKFRNQLIPILSTIQKLKKQNMNLSQQRDLLLPRLMSGKLEVK